MASDLQVKTSPRPQSRLALEVVVPAERCQRSYDKAMRQLCRTVRLPGFRPGRVPKTAVLQQLGSRQVWITALEQLLEDTAQDVLNDQDLNLLGKLQLQDSFDALAQQFKPSEGLTLNMEADVHPKATLKAYRDLEVEVEVEETSIEGMLETVLQRQRRSASTTVPLERITAEAGDVAVVELVPPSTDGPDGEASPEPGTRLEVDLVEENEILSMFVPLVIGMTVGETKALPNTTDSSAQQEGDQNDKADRGTVTLRELKARQMPELDDAFAQKVSHFATLAELKDALGQDIETQARKRNKEKRQDALLEIICEGMEVELPQSMVEQEMEAVMEDYKDVLRARGVDPEDLPLDEKAQAQLEQDKLEEAQRRVQHHLALETVAKKEQIIVAETELDVKVQALRRQLKARKARRLDPAKLRVFVKTGLLREKALAWLERHNTFKVRTTTEEEREEAPNSPAPANDLTESTDEQV